MAAEPSKTDRRAFLGHAARTTGALALAGVAGFVTGRHSEAAPLVWQLDPDQCTACGNCATYCVLDVSAVKCVNCFDMCGYCDICTGYFEMKYLSLDTAAENQMCPTAAIERRFIEERSGQRFYEYTIQAPLCIGCGKCVKGCALMNASMYLQVEHNRCLNCNECSIAIACPTQAFHRVPAEQAEILKSRAVQVLRSRGERLRRAAGDDADRRREADQLLARAERQLRWRETQQQLDSQRGAAGETAQDA